MSGRSIVLLLKDKEWPHRRTEAHHLSLSTLQYIKPHRPTAQRLSFHHPAFSSTQPQRRSFHLPTFSGTQPQHHHPTDSVLQPTDTAQQPPHHPAFIETNTTPPQTQARAQPSQLCGSNDTQTPYHQDTAAPSQGVHNAVASQNLQTHNALA